MFFILSCFIWTNGHKGLQHQIKQQNIENVIKIKKHHKE